MDEEKGSLKVKAFKGLFWKFSERILVQMVSLAVSIVLARLLTPDDYSVVGIVSIFFAFANVLISAGFNSALIQRKNTTIEDYSGVLWISLGMAIVMYAVIFFTAPYIARIYEKNILTLAFRIMGLSFIINAYKSVLCAYISNQLQFKKFFWSTFVGTFVSAVIGITMAIIGCGPWALVVQQMSNSIIDALVLTFSTKMKFVFRGSTKNISSLFNYGWKIWVSGIIHTIYQEINPLIIGLKYSSVDLAYYSKGRNFPVLVNATLSETVSSVMFPVMSKLQDNKKELLKYTRNYIGVTSFFVFPMMLGFLAISENFVRIVLTEKWLPSVIYMQIFCIVFMFNIIHTGNLQAIRALGRSDVILTMEIIKKTSYAIVILLFVIFTDRPELLALASIVNTVIATIVNIVPNSRLIGYKAKNQLLDVLPNLITSTVMCICVLLIGRLNMNMYALLVLQVVMGIIIYLLLNILVKNKNYEYVLNTIVSSVKSQKNKGSENEKTV